MVHSITYTRHRQIGRLSAGPLPLSGSIHTASPLPNFVDKCAINGQNPTSDE